MFEAFEKLSSDRHTYRQTDIQTRPKLYTTLLRLMRDNLQSVRDRTSVSIIQSLIASRIRIRAFGWYWDRWSWTTLNGVMAIILHYLTKFRSFGSQYNRSSWFKLEPYCLQRIVINNLHFGSICFMVIFSETILRNSASALQKFELYNIVSSINF